MDLDIWKKAKKEKKLTIAQIAEKANLPKGTVQNIFCGYIPNPRVDTVEAIEKALGLDEKPYDWYMLTPQENELITEYRQLIPAMRDYILDSVKKLNDAHQITVSLYCNIFRLSIGLLKIFEKFLIAIRGFRNFANGCI